MAWDKEGWEGGRIWISKSGQRTYYVWQMRGGQQYAFSLKVHSERDAFRKYEEFDKDPDKFVSMMKLELLDQKMVDGYAQYLTERGRSKGHIRRARLFIGDLKDDLKVDIRKATTADLLKALEGRSSRDMRVALFKGFWTYLETEKGFETNPTRRLKVRPSKPAQWTKNKVIKREHHEKLVKALKPEYADVLIVLAATGWHTSEVLRLAEVKMVPDQGVHKSKFKEGNPYVLVTVHKSGSIHQTLVNKPTMMAANRILRRLKYGEHFTNVAAFYRAIHAACTKLNIPQITPGRYRHTIATRAIEAGVDPAKVSAFLGHKSAATTKRFYSVHAIVPKIPTMD